MRRHLACAILAGLIISAAGCQEEETVKVQKLTLRGVKSIDESQLKSVLATRQSSIFPWGKKVSFNRAQFDADLKRIQAFYTDRGFPDARVTHFDVQFNKPQNAVDLSVDIVEGEPVRVAAIDLVGFEAIPPAHLTDLKKRMPLKVGRPLDRQLLLSCHELLLNELRDAGYPYAKVTIGEDEGPSGKSAALTLIAEPGRLAHFGPIDVAGNRSVGDRVIRRELAYQPGELYRRSLLLETQRRLYNMQLFQFVDVTQVKAERPTADVPAAGQPASGPPISGPPTSNLPVANGPVAAAPQATPQSVGQQATDEQPPDVPTRITVAEGKHERLNFGVGYGTEEKVRGDAEYRELNFLGGARTLVAHVRWSALDRGVRLNVTQPYFFEPHFSVGAEGQRWYAYTPVYQSVISGGKATLTHRTGALTSWTISIDSEQDSSSVVPAVLSNLSLRNDLIAKGLNPITGQQSGTLSALGFDFQRSTADNVLNAHRGYQLAFHAEQAGTILPGTYKYWSVSADAHHYLSFGDRLVWANRLQGANIDPSGNDDANIPFAKRYFLGGSTSIRGWGIYEVGPLAGGLPVGGDSMVAFSSEIRALLRGNLGGVLFLDGGNVWASSWGMTLSDLRYAVGTGLRYQTPIGPIRFDFGYQLNPESGLLVNGTPQTRHWRVHFSIGQAF